ncbi:hypothetical protein AVEN_107217-1 [Araneus ventricosus]|uniref:Uncharacterized protein n=1 Tax=Araneus ventricosus TaxID=182803 RepID=A0A4Y2N9S4_ARAVE|nr:hypothetical protein AVEN_263981-1 [Araneus ventricosus]GBN34586.1 hypothetical protein AVEN_107217-1 [Araneus ventricosus]
MFSEGKQMWMWKGALIGLHLPHSATCPFIAHDSTHFQLRPILSTRLSAVLICTSLNSGTAVCCFCVFFGTRHMRHCSSDAVPSVVNSGKVVLCYDNVFSLFVLHLLCE